MMNNLFKIIFFVLLTNFIKAQVPTNKDTHDRATEKIADVLFNSKTKNIRDQVKAFENNNNLKIQFKVGDQSLDQLGGLSEHLFKLFQNFTTLENVKAKTITCEFNTIKDNLLVDTLTYKTNVTTDLSACVLPLKDTEAIDSLYNKYLHGLPFSSEELNSAPAHLDDIFSQAPYNYEQILIKNKDCPGVFDANAYNQHVINTRQHRYSDWTTDANSLSLRVSLDYGHLIGEPSESDPDIINCNYVQTLNGCFNTCTKRDLEARCRLLYEKTNIRFLFYTKDLNYYIPADSMNKFRDAVTQTFTNNATDQVIIALYVKMQDGPISSGVLLVKQVNGDWLTNGDINFANYNNGGGYQAGGYQKFKNLFKNIPKPLIICYQVAKVNGLVTTSYFNKGQAVKGREQIYYHVFKTDAAFEEISQLTNQLHSLYSRTGGSGGSVVGTTGVNNSYIYEEIAVVKNKIRIAYLKAAKQPMFNEADEHFKEGYLKKKDWAEAGALRYVQKKYGLLYNNNKIDALIANTSLPLDIKIGSCTTSESSDVIADALNISSLLLTPTGLDFVPDLLAVAYFASSDNTHEMMWASASFLVPGNLSGPRKLINTSADAIKEINAGSKLLLEANQLSAIKQDVNHITSMFNIKPQDVDASLVSKINADPITTDKLLPISSEQAKVWSNTEKLDPPKRIEFVKKCYDDPDFRQKALADPDEVLRWGGIVELIRGVSKTDFLSSVTEFAGNPEIGEKAWNYFKNENWNQLENLFKNNNLNKYNDIIYPPNNGAINVVKKTLDPKDYHSDLIIDRYGSTAGKFTAPVNTPFPQRALPSTFENQTPQKYKVIQPILNVEEGQIIPWFNQPGMGLQYKLEKSVQYYIDEGFLLPIN